MRDPTYFCFSSTVYLNKNSGPLQFRINRNPLHPMRYNLIYLYSLSTDCSHNLLLLPLPKPVYSPTIKNRNLNSISENDLQCNVIDIAYFFALQVIYSDT